MGIIRRLWDKNDVSTATSTLLQTIYFAARRYITMGSVDVGQKTCSRHVRKMLVF